MLAWASLLAAGASGAAIGWGGGEDDAEAAGWTRAASMSQRRSYIAATELGGRVYTAGGMVGETGRPLPTFTRYDPRRDAWETLPQLPVATRAAAAATAGTTIYVLGGTTHSGNTRDVWAFERGRWRRATPLPAPRFNHAAVTVGGRLYVLGGFHDGRERGDVFVYDTRAGAWSRGPSLPRPTHGFDVVVFRGELWLLGGRRGEQVLREVWILDPVGGRWRRGPSMPKPMELLGAAVVGDEIHAVWESTYQIYDARERRWRSGPRPLVTRHALEAFYVAGALYTIGGCTTALEDSPVVERRPIP